MTTYFAGTITPTNDDWSVTSSGSGATMYAFISLGSRGEWSPLSPAKVITYSPTNPNITITFNSSLRATGCWLWEIAVGFSNTNNPVDAIFAGAWRACESDQVTERLLPATISFSNPELIKNTAASIAVANQSALIATTPKIHGMVRSVTAEGGVVYRWDAEASSWVVWRSSSIYQFAPRKPAVEINPATDWFLPPPIYPSNTLSEGSASTPIKYWLVNDGNANWGTNSAIDLQCAISNDLSLGYLLSGLCKLQITGKASVVTGVLDTTSTTTPNVNTTYTWEDSKPYLFKLQKTIEPNYALVVNVYLQYYRSQLVVPSGSLLQIIPLNVGQFSYQLPGFTGFEDWLVGLKLLPRIGGISDTGGNAKIGAWHFSDVQAGELTSQIAMPVNAAQQIVINAQSIQVKAVAINSTINNNSNDLYRTEGIIGIISTAPGVTAKSTPATLTASTGSVNVTVTHPTIINTSYPVIGGISSTVNAPYMYVYLTISGVIYRYTIPVNPGVQQIPITQLGTIVSSIPNATFVNDLFIASQPVLADGGTSGSLPTGTTITCQVQYAYIAPNTAVSSITMEDVGMLRQQSDILRSSTPGFWGIMSVSQLRALDTTNYTGKEWGRVIIGTTSNLYKFDSSLSIPDNNVSVIKPDDRAGAGRYIAEKGLISATKISVMLAPDETQKTTISLQTTAFCVIQVQTNKQASISMYLSLTDQTYDTNPFLTAEHPDQGIDQFTCAWGHGYKVGSSNIPISITNWSATNEQITVTITYEYL